VREDGSAQHRVHTGKIRQRVKIKKISADTKHLMHNSLLRNAFRVTLAAIPGVSGVFSRREPAFLPLLPG